MTAEVDLLLTTTDRVVRVAGNGTPGHAYTVEFTQSLAPPRDWQSLGTMVADEAGQFEYYDGSPAASSSGFYRVTSN